jgi:hypothetical protein
VAADPDRVAVAAVVAAEARAAEAWRAETP